ncbi:unnamed protein product [Miscanthus lutarioriparius]|uniref:Uncharacterized protein n=1 Tax=Miscanthus lutarioriparius TaxID=422564 RepID=A0A811P1R2_9POAL|nr:unnamed protein product [Miscanthus lutarioriparius]
MVAPSAFPPSAGSTDCDDTRPSSAPPVPSAGRAARPAERRNAGTPPIRPGFATLVCWGPVRSCCDPRIQLCRHSRFVVSPVALRSGFVYWPATHSLKAPAPLLFCTEPSIFIGAAHKILCEAFLKELKSVAH